MKSITLSFICFIVSVIILAILTILGKNRAKHDMHFPIITSLIPVPLYIGLYFFTPMNLYLFSDTLVENQIWVDFVNGLCLYTFLCIGFVDFLIAAITQPFTTDILVILHKARGKGMTYDEILNAYSDCSGLKHIFKKRYDYLLEGEYITKKNDIIQLTAKACQVVKFVRLLKYVC